MKVAIMQPYIFPYLGYFQLISAVDEFVFFDDVHFINKGWINRNQLLQQDKPVRFTIPLLKASQNRLINEIQLSEFAKWRKEFLKSVELNYKKAPHFTFIFKWLNNFFFMKDYVHIGDLAAESVKAVSTMLQLSTLFTYSSALNYKNNSDQNGVKKIQEICKILGADKYINPKNGVELYDKKQFVSLDIELNFINMNEVTYTQFKQGLFVPNLSIIDVLMFNNVSEVKQLLVQYELN